jgi:hypothetical protein
MAPELKRVQVGQVGQDERVGDQVGQVDQFVIKSTKLVIFHHSRAQT